MLYDMVPVGMTFVSAGFQNEDEVGGSLFYYTNTDFTDPQVHPTFDHTNLVSPGAGWSTTPPADPSTVTWVAYHVPQMSSRYFLPANPITGVVGLMNVLTDATPANACIESVIPRYKNSRSECANRCQCGVWSFKSPDNLSPYGFHPSGN